jgi:diguanylate cyclase (GGDEF)-like protein
VSSHLKASTEPVDERATMTRFAAYLWSLGFVSMLAGLVLPGAPHANYPLVAILAAGAGGHAFTCVRYTDVWARLPLWFHALCTAVAVVMIGVAVGSTGEARSYLTPALILAVLYIGLFFPPRFAWPLLLLLVAVSVAPLIYDPLAVRVGFPSKALTTVLAYGGATFAMQKLKWRLVKAEMVQRTMATQDALTGLANRRAFDSELNLRVTGGDRKGDRFALLFVDFDHFKQINDRLGHVTGDNVLRQLAERCDTVVRPDDLFARIGGDEFALIAPGVGGDGAEDIAARLRAVAREIVAAEDAPPVSITVAWASFPEDGSEPSELMRTADRRLHAAKDARDAHTYHLSSPAEYME